MKTSTSIVVDGRRNLGKERHKKKKTRRTDKKCYWDSKKKKCESLNSVVTKMSASLQCTRSLLTTSQSKIVDLKALILSDSFYWDIVRMGKKKVLSLLCNNTVFIFFIQHTTKQIEFQWLNMLHEIKVWGLYIELLMWTKWWWMLRKIVLMSIVQVKSAYAYTVNCTLTFFSLLLSIISFHHVFQGLHLIYVRSDQQYPLS